MRERLETRLLDSLPPVYRRVRQTVAARLTKRLAEKRDRTSDDGIFGSLQRVLLELEREAARCDADMEKLVRRHAAAQDDRARREVLVEHLKETVESTLQRQKDLRALKRWLDVDALRERMARRRHQLQIEEELALRCLVGVLPRDGSLPVTSALADLLASVTKLAQRSPRIQNQLAATEALGAILQAARLSATVTPQAETAVRDLLTRPELNPQLEAEAFRVLVLIDRERGLDQLRKRFTPPFVSKWDLLFRRHAVERVSAVLPREVAIAWLQEVGTSDPSEFVRMGVCERAALSADGERVLRELAGVAREEKSPKVRACALAALFESTWLSLDRACAVAAEVLHTDPDSLVLRVVCEYVLRLSERSGWSGSAPEALLAEALDELLARPNVKPVLAEIAGSARIALRCAKDPSRREWAVYLRRVLSQMTVGGRLRLRLDRVPLGIPPLPDDPRWLGELAAALSDRAYGVYLERDQSSLTIWRGDRFRRRLWRTLHELKHPAPNKRQAFFHTIGRSLPGGLRAHPGQLDEVTATQVPGERVLIPSQGGWGRHLPMVDDVLDLPLLGSRPIRIFSTHGETLISPPASFGRRVRNRLKISREYAHLAALRMDALQGRESHERKKYVETLERDLGVTIAFAPYDDAPQAPDHVRSLFPTKSAGAMAGVFGLNADWTTGLTDRLVDQQGYFLDATGNGVLALGLFTAGMFTVFLADSWWKRHTVRTARAKIPLCIGGWGTRGKSGTERLKAALFAGLGFDVLAKTTGSEAQFVQTGSGLPSAEFFIFRPYDKATIWEQRDLLQLASKLDVEVFLWECMALQPGFVDLLQNDWMKDDVSTLTNAYPDHEDIQGPAGMDVAKVITNFMAHGGNVVTTEDQFLPLFHEAARKKSTRLNHSPWWEAELIPEELLALFPYREHPRNVALVLKMAEQLGISRTVAIGYLAEHVQPEIGVLKAFPTGKIRGRLLTFINGHSANERTGFLNNWRRMGLDALDPETSPERGVMTVINNRWDRVARSQVFARIIVEDAAADRHVLIGTNLEGLQKYIRASLNELLERTVVVTPTDFDGTRDANWAPTQRLARQLAQMRVPTPTRKNFFARLEQYARGANLAFVPTSEFVTRVETLLAGTDEVVSLERLKEKLEKEISPLLDASLVSGDAHAGSALPEVLEHATHADVKHHGAEMLAKLVLHAHLLHRLHGLKSAADAASFHERFKEVYREIFLSQIVSVHDAHATGDQVVEACARAVPPGLETSIMGAQNIKGTGLDWVYRWVALDKVSGALEGLRSASAEARRRAMDLLESFEDHGFVDAGLARAQLPELIQNATSNEESERLRRIHMRISERHSAKLGALAHKAQSGMTERIAQVFESGFDYLDSVKRRRLAEVVIDDLIEGRISRARAALEMRKLYERQKGGWLVGRVRKLREAPVQTRPAAPETLAPLGGEETLRVPEELAGNVLQESAAPPQRAAGQEDRADA